MKHLWIVLILAFPLAAPQGGYKSWLLTKVREQVRQDVSDGQVCRWCFLCGEESRTQYTRYRLSREVCQMCADDCGPPCNVTCNSELLNFPAVNESMANMMGNMTDPAEVGMDGMMGHLQELETMEPTCGAQTLHWKLTGRRVFLEHGHNQMMTMAFSDQTLDGLVEDSDFTEECPEFQSRMSDCAPMEQAAAEFPALMGDMMAGMVPDCHAMVSSFNCTDNMEMSQTGDTMMDMGANWAIKTYPCTLEYNPSPVARRGYWRIIIVNGRPLRVFFHISFG